MSVKKIGIDPGLSGGIAIIENGKLSLHKIPTIKNKLDIDSLDRLMFDIMFDTENEDSFECMCVLEDVHSIFGTSAKSNFSFGRTLGVLEGLLTGNRIPYKKIAPKEWQKEAWRGVKVVKINTGKKLKSGKPKYKIDTKATSLLAAKQLFPNESFLATERSKVPHDGLVDAALMAWYCKLKY